MYVVCARFGVEIVYQLLVAFCDKGDDDFISVVREYRHVLRMSLIDAVEKNHFIGLLAMLRIGNYVPYGDVYLTIE